jgi:LmbE family N-acetylglucosaminyl deacetylase
MSLHYRTPARSLAIAALALAGGMLSGQVAVNGRETAATISVDSGTRLLVVAPHPDDEVLGAGGLMQHVRAIQGAIHVVFLTDGEGYPAGVTAGEPGRVPTSRAYRRYGRRRQLEARAALGILGIGREALTFLGFPNNGLSRLMTRYWSERRVAYRSPYTRLDRPPQEEMLEPDTEFRGEDLTEELARVIGDFKPTVIVVPRKEDQHVDHCAAWFFVADALGGVARAHPDFHTDIVAYVVHFYSWPFEDDAPTLKPPPNLSGGLGWISVPLTPLERQAKRAALSTYKSQIAVMDWFLYGFARNNEMFSRPVMRRIPLPVRRSPCDEFIDTTLIR